MRVRLAAVLLLAMGAGAIEAQKRAITEKDLFDFKWIGDTQLSPDGAFDHSEEFRKCSPITYVKNIQTPMMFILGEAGYRTPPTAGGEDFYRALKYRKIDTAMVRFPGESPELSRSGQPWHRGGRLENMVNWFDKYLMGLAEPQYGSGSSWWVYGHSCEAWRIRMIRTSSSVTR